MATFSDEQVMLCLAGLCYRSFNSGTGGDFHLDTVERSIAAGLESLAPLTRDWELVWGPAVYRAPGSLLDDELMYVVRRRTGPRRYVVAIRGTNPVSAFDWVFGDFWTRRVVPWPYTNGGEALSLSTALGLAVLQRVRSPRPEGITADIRDDLRGLVAPFGRLAQGIGTLATDTLLTAVEPLRDELVAVLRRLAERASENPARDTESRLLATAARWRSNEVTLLTDVLRAADRLAGPRLDLAVLALLQDDAALRASFGAGAELRPFLAQVMKDDPTATDVVVTGHSKGGALASTVALWLAETRALPPDAAEQWDPGEHAKVHCYSFAGPTAGNAAFAARSDALLGGRCHRIANPFDIVPHAWMHDDLAKVPTLYQGAVRSSRALGDLIAIVSGLTRDLAYAQIGELTEPAADMPGFAGPDQQRPVFYDQFVHQHMEAYLQAFDLTKHGITTRTFFDPLAVLPQ